MENKSDKEFWDKSIPLIRDARERAKRNNAWAESHGMVNPQTGEIVSNQEGEKLTLAQMSKSWYSEQGARNSAFSIVKRMQRVNDFQCDLKKYRPKFITLTFADVFESWEKERTIQKFVDGVRHWAKRQGANQLAYCWTAEVQMKNGRGALHYHILLLGLPFIPKEQLAEWWPYGFIDARAVDDLGRAFKYLAKYLWKWGKEAADPDTLPDWWFLFSVHSKRRYGFSKFFTLPPAKRVPRWLKEILQACGALDDLVKAGREQGGGWLVVVDRPNGQVPIHFDSPFQVVELHP